MTHERECWANYDDACLCDELRTAYQRGREDAARAVEAAWNEPMTRDAYDFADWPTLTIDAARGDSNDIRS